VPEDPKGTGANANAKDLLNGSSLSRLTGAVPSAKLQVEVRYPASSIAEVMESIHKLGRTGNLTVNYSEGRAMDLKWSTTRKADAPDV